MTDGQGKSLQSGMFTSAAENVENQQPTVGACGNVPPAALDCGDTSPLWGEADLSAAARSVVGLSNLRAQAPTLPSALVCGDSSPHWGLAILE